MHLIHPIVSVLSAISVVVFLSSSGGGVDDPIRDVTQPGNSGPGSFRAAVDAANRFPHVRQIRFASRLEIVVDADVVYTGRQALTLIGSGSRISGSGRTARSSVAGGGLFISRGGADLFIEQLDFVDSFDNGIAVFVPPDRTGSLSITLDRVAIERSRFHGLLIDGQRTRANPASDSPASDVDWIDPHPFDSRASIVLRVEHSSITENGTAANDRLHDPDSAHQKHGCPALARAEHPCGAGFSGIKVSEGGEGGIHASIRRSEFRDNHASGLELDERGPGDLTIAASQSRASRNGRAETLTSGTGIRVVEADDGTLTAEMIDVETAENTEEGIGLSESGEGSITASLFGVTSSRNQDDGLRIREKNAGDLHLTTYASSLKGSARQAGFDITEEGEGDLTGVVVRSKLKGNKRSGLIARQGHPGAGKLSWIKSVLGGNGDVPYLLEGVQEQRETSSRLFATAVR